MVGHCVVVVFDCAEGQGGQRMRKVSLDFDRVAELLGIVAVARAVARVVARVAMALAAVAN